MDLLPAETFHAFGFLTRRGFLSAADCARLKRAMRSGAALPGEIRAGGRGVRSRINRRVDVVRVSAAARARVDRALRALLPALEEHFGRRLRGHEPVQFLRYGRGGRYVLHTDRTPGTRLAVTRRPDNGHTRRPPQPAGHRQRGTPRGRRPTHRR